MGHKQLHNFTVKVVFSVLFELCRVRVLFEQRYQSDFELAAHRAAAKAQQRADDQWRSRQYQHSFVSSIVEQINLHPYCILLRDYFAADCNCGYAWRLGSWHHTQDYLAAPDDRILRLRALHLGDPDGHGPGGKCATCLPQHDDGHHLVSRWFKRVVSHCQEPGVDDTEGTFELRKVATSVDRLLRGLNVHRNPLCRFPFVQNQRSHDLASAAHRKCDKTKATSLLRAAG